MDLEITKENQVVRLSQFGFYNINIKDSSPAVEVERRSVKGRSGYIFDGLTYTQKEIKVTARILVSSLQEYFKKVDEVNGFLFNEDPYYICKMYPTVDNIYDFETPGAKTGDLDLQNVPHTNWHYRYKVVPDGEVEFDFIGRSESGLKYNVSFQFMTAELPFGETVAKDLTLKDGIIPYNGTAPFSQLEKPWIVELVSSGGQSSFYLTIGNRKYTFTQQSPIATGTVIRISGVETTVNKVNMTNKTNYEYFVIEPTISKQVSYKTDFKGTIKILDFMELYR